MARDTEPERGERKKRAPGAGPAGSEEKKQTIDVKISSTTEVIILVAAALDERVRKKLAYLSNDHFRWGNNAKIWAGVLELERRGLEYSRDTMESLIGAEDADTLATYISDRPTVPKNLGHHIELLVWDKKRHDVATGALPELIESIRDPQTDPGQTQKLAKQVSEQLAGGTLKYLRDARSVAAEHDIVIGERITGRAIYTYGLDGLDKYGPEDYRVDRVGDRIALAGKARCIPGPSPGTITVNVGVSKSGKTTAVIAMTSHWSKEKRKVLWGAWENTPGPSLETVALYDMGVSREQYKSGDINQTDRRILREKMESYQDTIRFFDLPFGKERGQKLDRFERGGFNDRHLDLIHQYVEDSGCEIFVADLFRKALVELKPEDEERALNRMQAIAAATKCHFFLVHQLRFKDIEQRADKRPTREGIKGAGAWVEVADTILAWYKPSMYGGPEHKVECHLLAQRHAVGEGQVIEFDTDLDYGVIENGHTIQIVKAEEGNEIDSFMGQQIEIGGRSGGGTQRRTRKRT